ncbi:MAG: SH3 domain-containing protein [Clostridia bacterium]|nr:SH3 domain-containing protein [Clostridia bacterium]
MKKIILILLSLLMALALASCEANHDPGETVDTAETTDTEKPADTAGTEKPADTATDPAQTQAPQTPSDETAEAIDKYVEFGTLVDAEALNVRSGAGSAFTRLGVLLKGETVEILEKNCAESDGYTWHKILYEGAVGYVVAGNQTDNFRFEFRHLTSSDDGSVKSEAVSFEKYIGTWRDGLNPPNDFFIVTQKDNGEIQCGWSVYRLASFYFVITAKDGEFTFEDDWGRMSGTIDFIGDAICVKVEETVMEGTWSGHLFTEKEDDQPSESPALTFVSRQERLSWKDKIERFLSNYSYYEYGKHLDFGVALMDLNFDHTPEVIVAYPGGSMGNVNIEVYDLESGEIICDLGDTPHYRRGDHIYLCIYGNDKGDYLIVNEGSLRNGLEWYNLTSVLKEKDGAFKFDVLFEEVIESDDSRRYYYVGEEVDQIEFEKQKELFQNGYKEIAETKIQIVNWNSIDAKNEREEISMMAAALVSSDQQFIDYGIDYKEAYLDFLKDKKDSHRAFALVFIDGDEIPELYMSGVSEAEGDEICTLRNGVVTRQHLQRNGGGKYVEKSGTIINRNGHMGYYYDHAYKLDGNGFTQTLDASYIERCVHIGNGEYDVECEYFINGYPVSEAVYQNRVNAVFDFSNAIRLDDGAVSYDEIVDRLTSGNASR